MTHPHLADILGKLRQYLERVYGDRLVQVMLYGSQARGEATIASDIDVLVVLQPPMARVEAYQAISEFVADLCLEYDTLISCVLVDSHEFDRQETPLLQNIRCEGLAV